MEFGKTLDQELLDAALTVNADRWLMLQTVYTATARREALYRMPAGPKSRIADVGCGFGAASLELAEHFGSSVDGFDQEPSRLEMARHLLGRFPNLIDRVSFFTEDVTLYVPPTPFDILLARFVLQYLPVDATLIHWRKWLKPGGCLYLEEVDDGWTVEHPPLSIAWRRVIAAYQDYAADHGSDRQIGRKLPDHLIRAGYKLTRVLWNPRSFLGPEQLSDPQVQFERERMSSLRQSLVVEGYLTEREFEEGLHQFDAAYPKMSFITGATLQVWAEA